MWSLTDLELSLYSPLTPFPVVGLRSIVLRHYFHELPGQRWVLSLAYPEICRRFVRVFLLLDVLLYHYTQRGEKKKKNTDTKKVSDIYLCDNVEIFLVDFKLIRIVYLKTYPLI